MKNDLLNTKLLEKYQDKFTLNVKKHDLLKEYIEKVEKEEFKDEVANYINFYEYILRGVLGYKTDDLDYEGKVDDTSQRVEFALKFEDKKFMVIELKGQGTDLDNPQKGRKDSRSPVDQAFGYAIHIGSAEWIMVSDYEEFRLYNYHKKTNYISFNARELTDKKIFKWFMLAFSKESHEKGYLDKISSQTQIIERKLEDEFYKLYHETRLMIIKELEEIRGFKREDAVHYAQLLLNRYMFICFAEDMGLLPAQISVQTITNSIKSRSVRRNSIWHNLNDLFLDINEGDPSRDIFPYNGGLFKEEFDQNIVIRDLVDDPEFFKETRQGWIFNEYSVDIESLVDPYQKNINPIYKNLLTISSFDFRSDLDVNIMGHIFENSIGDLEDLKEDRIGRRKKEGVYYTPDYITDYICRNTIIPYLSKTGKPDTVEKLLDEYFGSEIDELDQKVKNIRIVDPACGSGAFLNRAADILLDIHQAIHERKYSGLNTLDKHFDSVEERRSILLDNIYGVDLNEESVEITKLALFLNIFKRKGVEKEKARPMQLPNIDKNIRCGNSIIDGPEYTEKPFKWEEEFPFKFDIVIGNPPYGAKLSKNEKKFVKANYLVKNSETAQLMMERSYSLLKNGGYHSFIIPKAFTFVSTWGKIRKKFLEDLNVLIDCKKVWEEVKLEQIIYTIQKGKKFNKYYSGIRENHSIKIIAEVDKSLVHKFDGILLNSLSNKEIKIGSKIKEIKSSLANIGKNKWGDVFYKEINNNKKGFKVLGGNEIQRYYTRGIKGYIEEKFIKTEQSLIKPNSILLQRIIAHIENPIDHIKIAATIFENSNYRIVNTVHQITLDNEISNKYVLAVINSNFMNWFVYRFIFAKAIRSFQFSRVVTEKIPIPKISLKQQKPFIEKADKMLKLNKKFQDEIYGFKDWLTTTFGVEKFSKKLDKYYELDFTDFLKELKKKKVDTSSRKNQELLKKEFNNSIAKIEPLKAEIRETDAEIDRMVYKLHDLTEEEIQIIEDSLKK